MFMHPCGPVVVRPPPSSWPPSSAGRARHRPRRCHRACSAGAPAPTRPSSSVPTARPRSCGPRCSLGKLPCWDGRHFPLAIELTAVRAEPGFSRRPATCLMSRNARGRFAGTQLAGSDLGALAAAVSVEISGKLRARRASGTVAATVTIVDKATGAEQGTCQTAHPQVVRQPRARAGLRRQDRAGGADRRAARPQAQEGQRTCSSAGSPPVASRRTTTSASPSGSPASRYVLGASETRSTSRSTPTTAAECRLSATRWPGRSRGSRRAERSALRSRRPTPREPRDEL